MFAKKGKELHEQFDTNTFQRKCICTTITQHESAPQFKCV